MGMIVVNAGNGFRMRMSIAPLILFPSAFIIGYSRVYQILKSVIR